MQVGALMGASVALASLVSATPGCCAGSPTTPGLGGPIITSLRDDMPYNDMPYNSLSPDALRAYTPLLTALSTHALDDATLEGARGILEADPNARAFVKYVVSCALPRNEVLGSGLSRGAGDRTAPPWEGRLGLCGSDAGDWRHGRPNDECLERVSSCVLALVNRVEAKVIVSFRGEKESLFPSRPRVRVSTEYRESHGTPIHSFLACPDGAAPGDEKRNCGWAPLDVGVCSAGETVTVTTAVPGAMLRACKGLYGCDDPATPGFTPPPGRGYGGCLPGEGRPCAGAPEPTVKLTCPNNGPLRDPTADPTSGRRIGYYSLMIASKDSVSPPGEDKIPDGHITASSGDYPAREKAVFTYREGAFHGNVFVPPDPPKLTAGAKEATVLFKQQYACYSDAWSAGMAYMSDRWCAGTEARCFENAPNPCLLGATAVCEAEDTASGAYKACHHPTRSSPPRWSWPITVYLNHPCDLAKSDDPQICGIPAAGNGPAYVPPR